MLAFVAPDSAPALAVLISCFVLVLAFAFSNGFHDTANAVAGRGGAVFILVELLPPDVLTPPNGNPAIAMLLSPFLAALIWNGFGILCPRSHAIISLLIGYKRIVTTNGERHLSPAQGASAELVGAALIGTPGFSGLLVSTTHIVASGVPAPLVVPAPVCRKA